MRQLMIAILVMFGFIGTALASAGGAVADDSLPELLRMALEALMSGKGPIYSAAIALVLLVALARRYGTSRVPFLASDKGGALLVLLGSFAGMVAASIKAGELPGLDMYRKALYVAVGAAGGYSLVKRLVIDPIVRPLVAKLPTWLRLPLSALLSIFDSQVDKIKTAEVAGAAAVKANPGPGTAGVVGTPRDVE